VRGGARSWFPGWHSPQPEGPVGLTVQEAASSGRERRQHHQVLGSGQVHQTGLFKAPKISTKTYLPKNIEKVSISTTGTVVYIYYYTVNFNEITVYVYLLYVLL